MKERGASMAKRWAVPGILAGLLAGAARGEGPVAPPVAGEYKIVVAGFGVKADPIVREEIVARNGRIYHFTTGSKEVAIIDPARGQVNLLDLARRVETVIPFARLDEGLVKLKGTLNATIRDREAKGGRANAIEAEMTRDLVDPRFRPTSDAASGRLRMANPTVEVEATGEPDADAARLASIAVALRSIAKVGAFRDPTDLPPFIELDAITALAAERRLRPTEISYLYRLAGPPRRLRRTYRLQPDLTPREREAIDNVDRFREAIREVRHEQYRAR